MTEANWDLELWNKAQLARELVHLGAVILKPPSKPAVGFFSPSTDRPEEPKKP